VSGPLADPAVRRVALVRLRLGLGDLLCSLPALRRLRVARPDLQVTLVTWPQTAAVVQRMGDAVDELLPFPGADDVPDRPPEMAFPLTPDDEAEHAATLDRAGLVPGGYAVLHPGASSPTRRWPAERYAAVGDALAADGLAVVVTGGPGELAVGAAVVAAMRAPAVDLTGATSLGGLAVLLRDAAVLVGNDTGSAHLAAAVGARSVTVFLPGDPVRWAHPGPRHRALVADVPCAPCPHLVCPIDFRCADSVRPGDVLAAARALVPR